MSCTIVMCTIQLIIQHIGHFFFLSIRLSVCLHLFIISWCESKREKAYVRSLTHVVCDNILLIDERNLFLSVCLSVYLKSIHIKQVYTIYIYANMIKGYITGRDRVIVWTNHFVHNKDTTLMRTWYRVVTALVYAWFRQTDRQTQI
jgi:hypothetical protein